MPRPGQVLGLVGANGTGKSTALKILAGKLKPNLGDYEVAAAAAAAAARASRRAKRTHARTHARARPPISVDERVASRRAPLRRAADRCSLNELGP